MKIKGTIFAETSDAEDWMDFLLHGDEVSEILLGDDFRTDSEKKYKDSNCWIGWEKKQAPPADTYIWEWYSLSKKKLFNGKLGPSWLKRLKKFKIR